MTWPFVTLMEELAVFAISILSVWVPIASVASLLAIVRLLTFPVVVERHGIGTVAAKVDVVGAARDLAGVPVCRRVPSAASRLAL